MRRSPCSHFTDEELELRRREFGVSLRAGEEYSHTEILGDLHVQCP